MQSKGCRKANIRNHSGHIGVDRAGKIRVRYVHTAKPRIVRLGRSSGQKAAGEVVRREAGNFFTRKASAVLFQGSGTEPIFPLPGFQEESGLGKFIVKRILSAIPTLIIVLTLVFMLMRMLPGNPVYIMYDTEDMTKEQIDELTYELGFDRPWYVQYWEYLKGILRGDWGNSYSSGNPVFGELVKRLEPTALLTVYSTIITVVIGIPIGIIAATHRNSPLDFILSSGTILFMVMPGFWVGIMMVYLLAFRAKLFPLQGYTFIERKGFWNAMYCLTMPAFAMGLSHVASVARHTRSQMLNVLKEDYIRTAKAKGLPRRKVLYKHALKNTLGLVLTIISNSFAAMLGGSVVMENVFNIRGVGRLALDSLNGRDYPQEQCIVIFMAVVFMVVNILMDIVYKLLDPRINFD